MKLLKTVLLSTSLLISATFAANADNVIDAEASPGRRDEVLQTVRAFEAYKKQNAATVIRFLTRDAGLDSEALGLTAESNYVEIMKKLSAVLKDLTEELKETKTGQATTKEQLNTVTAANEKLTLEKEAVEKDLVAVREQLAAVTADKETAAKKIEAARAEVAHLETALEAEQAKATNASDEARTKIKELTAQLTAAKTEVTALTVRVAELDTLKAAAEETKRQKEAGLRALRAHAGAPLAALKDGQSAAANSDTDMFAEFDTLPIGAEEPAGSPRTPLEDASPDSLDNASPLQIVGESPRALTADLDAAATATEQAAEVARLAAEKAEKIKNLQAELAAAVAATTASPHTGTGQKKKNEAAQAAAKATVASITAELVRLGVKAEAATASK